MGKSARNNPGRPRLVVLVVGTNTDIGKTWVTCQAIGGLVSQGYKVSARKPVQSCEISQADLGTTDADLLARETGEPSELVCPKHRTYPVPLAPPMAARLLGRDPVLIDDLAREINWDGSADFCFVESVGGICSPIAENGDSRNLISKLSPDVLVLVADSGLGTITHIVSGLDSLHLECKDRFLVQPGLEQVIFLNRFNPNSSVHRGNLDWLNQHLNVQVLTEQQTLVRALKDRLAR